MDIDLAALPDDVETLQRMVRTLAAERTALSEAQAEIERLQLIVQKLQRNQFGRRAERLDDGQLHLFAFRGRRADTVKILFWDGNGLCLFTERQQQGRFIWPSLREPGGTVMLTPAQLAMRSKALTGAHRSAPGSLLSRVDKMRKPAWNMTKLLDRIRALAYDSSCSSISTIFRLIPPCCIALCATWRPSSSSTRVRSTDSS
jgi:transposase